MKLLSIQLGKPRTLGDENAGSPEESQWTTGFYKMPVEGAVTVGQLGLAGDGQADLKNHGGIDKAICAYPREHLVFWEQQLCVALHNGAFGENFSLTGLLEAAVCLGDVFTCGTAVLQISQPRQPCWKLARRWGVKDLAARVEQTGRTGWYFRVLSEGSISAPADLALIQRPHPEWSVAAANEVMHHRKTDAAEALSLASCPALSASWQISLTRRAQARVSQEGSPPSLGDQGGAD